MTLDLFTEDTELETNFTAIVIFPDGEKCARKFHSTLYEAKLWLIEKLFLYKHLGNTKQFPFGFDCGIITESKMLTFKELELL